MKTKITLYKDTGKKLPWIIQYEPPPHRITGKIEGFTKAFKTKREAIRFRKKIRPSLSEGEKLMREIREFEDEYRKNYPKTKDIPLIANSSFMKP